MLFWYNRTDDSGFTHWQVVNSIVSCARMFAQQASSAILLVLFCVPSPSTICPFLLCAVHNFLVSNAYLSAFNCGCGRDGTSGDDTGVTLIHKRRVAEAC
jgi:hypothetical protein